MLEPRLRKIPEISLTSGHPDNAERTVYKNTNKNPEIKKGKILSGK
jgi:hypothetical protein